jgi:septal ring factor EnvC (AmiA/AmiB activator)
MSDFEPLNNVIPLRKKGSGGGPEDPVLEQRVAAVEVRLDKLEVKIDRIDQALQRLEPAIRDVGLKFAELNARVAGVEGQLRAMPTFLQLVVALITTWSAGTAIVFALLKAIH